jgi:hypothetical protein
MRKLFKILLLLTSTAIFAEQTPPVPCSADEHRQFDFWLGHWTSYSKEGKKQGTNHLTKLMGQCVIQENWESGGGKFKGTSFNFYDPARKEWHQTWVDSSGGTLRLDGGLVGGSMQLSGQRTGSNGDKVVERITWTPLEDGRVRQHWQTTIDEGANWTEVFDGYYRRDED